MFKGGTIFVDHASGLRHVVHQLTFTANKIFQAKLAFKRMAIEHGVEVSMYQVDNGIFHACKFLYQYHLQHQCVHFSGVGAHYQNGIAERVIQMVR